MEFFVGGLFLLQEARLTMKEHEIVFLITKIATYELIPKYFLDETKGINF